MYLKSHGTVNRRAGCLNQMNRQVLVDNRPGGAGAVSWSSVGRAPADGYTVRAGDMSLAIATALVPNLPVDARKRFTQIATAAEVPHALVVTSSLPVKNVKELIALANARPGERN